MLYLLSHIGALILLPFVLNLDFKKDLGENIKAKIYHSIFVLLLVFIFTSAIFSISWLIRGDGMRYRSEVEHGMIPESLNLVLYYLSEINKILIFLLAFGLAMRKKWAKKWLSLLLVYWLLDTWLVFLRTSELTDDILSSIWREPLNSTLLVWLIGIMILQVSFVLTFILIYRSKFMNTFFNYQRIHEREEFQNFGKSGPLENQKDQSL